jgi:N utilization substance protein A
VDAVGACVGVRGSRIKNIVDELGGEKIDIVRWNESSQILIQNSLKPAEVQEVALCFELGKATVVVAEDQLSLAIGKRGQNVRLGSRLTRWDIDILTPAEYNRHLESLERTVKSVEGVDDVIIDKLIAMGCVSVGDLDEVGPKPLVNELELDAELAERIVEAAGEEAIKQEEDRLAAEKAKAEARAAGVEPVAAEAEAAGEDAVTVEADATGSEATASDFVEEPATPEADPQPVDEAASAEAPPANLAPEDAASETVTDQAEVEAAAAHDNADSTAAEAGDSTTTPDATDTQDVTEQPGAPETS